MSQVRQLLAIAAVAGGVLAAGVAQQPLAPQTAAVTAPAPKATRSFEHRKTHRAAPKSARPKWTAIPGVRPIPPIAKEEKRGRVKRKVQAQKKARNLTASQCARLRNGIAKFGSGVARIGARAQGYTDEQFDLALKQCGI